VHASDPRVVEELEGLPAGRILVNAPTTDGAVGGVFNRLRPSLTLTCGTAAGNDRLDNISIEHLIQVRRVVERRDDAGWRSFGVSEWSDPSLGAEEAFGRYRAADQAARRSSPSSS
jgi:hypothetical protein